MSNFESVTLSSDNPEDCIKILRHADSLLKDSNWSSGINLEFISKNNKSLIIDPCINHVTWGDIGANDSDRYWVENIPQESVEKLVIAFSEGDEQTLRLFENWYYDPTRKRF